MNNEFNWHTIKIKSKRQLLIPNCLFSIENWIYWYFNWKCSLFEYLVENVGYIDKNLLNQTLKIYSKSYSNLINYGLFRGQSTCGGWHCQCLH